MGRRRQPLFQALEPAQLSSGLQPDMHPLLSLLWEAAANVSFYAGRVKRRTPPATIHDVNDKPVRGLSQQQAANGVRWLWSANVRTGSDAEVEVYRWFAGAPESISFHDNQRDEVSTAPASFVDFTHYGDWTIINNGLITPQVHKPGVSFGPLGNAPAGATTLLKKLSFVLAVGYGSRGTRVGWSDSEDIEEWTAAADNLAGALTIDDFDTRIKAAAHLGTHIAVYAEDQMALVTYIGGTAVFGFKMALDGIGACGKKSVCSNGNQHFGVGRNGVWATDALSYRYIDEGFLHDYLQDNVNWDQQSKIQACRNDYTGCIDFAFPMRLSGSLECTEGWSFDPRTGGWSPIPAFAVKDERRLFGKPILGTADGKVMRDQDLPDGEGQLLLKTKPLLMQVDNGLAVHTNCRIDQVVLLLKSAVGIQFKMSSSQHADDGFTEGPWIDCQSGTDTYDLGPELPDGVYWKLEFRSTMAAWSFDLQGFMLFGTVEGTKRDAA